MPASLIVLIGEIGRHLHHIKELVRAGAVVLVAPTEEEAQRWLEPAARHPRRGGRPHEIVRFGDLAIDLTAHRATWGDASLPLTERELQLLAALAEDPGRAWSFAELTERAWGTSYYGGSGPLSAAVQRLRRKLDRAGVEVTVESVRGVGFRLHVERRRPPMV